ncbi:MAG: efflux RND transporter periplasmic adaptor subunit [Planctomycetaceae bacterium]|nr:efflux RND transporter periplasmic adaptor subunit [Planctomycetaceae bacterium]
MNDSKPHARKRSLKLALIFAAGVLTGILIYAMIRPAQAAPNMTDEIAADKQEVWTCSMHPQIRQPKPGKCPICFMDLIPVASSKSELGPRQVEYSAQALKLMELETTPVQRKVVEAEIRLVGKVSYDQTRVKTIAARVPGRIDQLQVNFTGVKIEQGQPMAELYSPELLSAQAELLQAVKAGSDAGGDTLMQRTLAGTAEASREKLRLLGLSPKQIQQIETSGKVSEHIIIEAPIGGVVIAKDVNEGQYLQTGQGLFTIADLSSVWVMLDAYEADLPHVNMGQKVEFTSPAYPGEVFHGSVSFIDPVVNPQTRTVGLRVQADNPNGLLKPEMFVRAIVRHPIGNDSNQNAPLVIPATAPLLTGKRAVVYVKVPHTEKPTFEGRQVVLGPQAGEYYVIEQGLSEGDQVVTKGAFKIDADLQIQAKPSMMNPEGGAAPAVHEHGGSQPMPAMPGMPGM